MILLISNLGNASENRYVFMCELHQHSESRLTKMKANPERLVAFICIFMEVASTDWVLLWECMLGTVIETL